MLPGEHLALAQPILTTRLPARPRGMGDADRVAQCIGIEAGVVVAVDQAPTLLRADDPTPLIVGWRNESHDRLALNEALRDYGIGS